jgi:hypothetical protein
MPTEKIWVHSRLRNEDIEIDAYLAECRSMSGFSGSPVIWNYVLNVFGKIPSPTEGTLSVITDRIFFRSLLGLVSGHFDVDAQHVDKATSQLIEDSVTKTNSGLAIVTPAENIRYLLMEDERVVKDRRERSIATKRVG